MRADALLGREGSPILPIADVALMQQSGVFAFLVGDAFMRAPDPGSALAALFGG